jgi:hypothetical protein
MSGYQESDRETDGMRLLDEARRAGLYVYQADDGHLVIEGPKSHDKLARALLKAKADVVAALAQQPAGSPGVCTRCGEWTSYRVEAYWSRNEQLCSRCCEWGRRRFRTPATLGRRLTGRTPPKVWLCEPEA